MVKKFGSWILAIIVIVFMLAGILFILEKFGVNLLGGRPTTFVGTIQNVSPKTLDHNYQETLFLVSGKGLLEEIQIGGQPLIGISIKIPRTPWEVGKCGALCHGESTEEVAAGFLQVPPTVNKRLAPGSYDVVVKKDGNEVAKLVQAVEVLPNPYAMTKWPWWLGTPGKKVAVAVAMIFVVAIIGGALFFIFKTKKQPTKKATTPAQPPAKIP